MKFTAEELEKKAYKYRKRFLELFTAIGFGHVTSAFSWADIATVLYNEIIDIATDRMFVSKGHGAGILYPIFEDLGLITRDELNAAIQIGGSSTRLRELYYPGFDFYGGSLGIGLGCATGLAKAGKVSGSVKNVYCIVGDAECYEGSIWEAVAFAGFQKLDNLIVILDRNRLGCSDFTEHMLALEPMDAKWRAFNWDVAEIDGHSISAIYDVLRMKANEKTGQPHCIIANTNKGQGLDYLINRPLMHGYMPHGDDVEKAFRMLK